MFIKEALLIKSQIYRKKQKTADLVTFTEEILHGKYHFLCSENIGDGFLFSENAVHITTLPVCPGNSKRGRKPVNFKRKMFSCKLKIHSSAKFL